MNTPDRDFGTLLAGLIELYTHAPLDPPIPDPRTGAEHDGDLVQTLARSGGGPRAQ